MAGRPAMPDPLGGLLVPRAAAAAPFCRGREARRIAGRLARLRLLAEGLRKTRIVRGYGMEDFEHEHFQHHLDKFRTNVLHVLNMQHYLRLAVGFLVLAASPRWSISSEARCFSRPSLPDVSHLWFSTALLMLASRGGHAASPGRVVGTAGAAAGQRSQAADRIYRYLNQIPGGQPGGRRQVPRARVAHDRLRGRLLHAAQQTKAARRAST